MRCKDYGPHMCLFQLDKSVVTELSIKSGHYINFRDATVLAMTIQDLVTEFDTCIKQQIRL